MMIPQHIYVILHSYTYSLNTFFDKLYDELENAAEAEKINQTGFLPWENVDNQLLCTSSRFPTLSEGV